MINCVDKFNNPSTVIRFLQANVPLSGTITGQFDGAFFKFEMTENETIFFTLTIQPNTVQAINVQFTLYRKDGEIFTNLGTSQNDDFNNNFDYAATPAEYYICITTDHSIDYTLNADFTDFPFVLIADCDAYGGEYIPPVEFARPESVCDSPVFYKIIEGTLPTGLEFSADGVITGVPVEQDCEPAAKDMPPSFTWWEENDDGVRESTGVDHRIVVRAALVDAPETFADREFFVCVRNNWDQDRDHFMGLKDEWETEVFIRSEDQPTLELTTEEPVVEPVCPVCPEPEVPQQASLEELKELAKMVQINEEFQGLVEINNEGLCVVCPEPEEQTGLIQLETIELEYCEPCPEPIVIEGLQDLPLSMCPCPVDEVEPVPVQEYVPGVPVICYPELLQGMIDEKVCDDRPVCKPVVEIYPPPVLPDQSLKSTCEPCDQS